MVLFYFVVYLFFCRGCVLLLRQIGVCVCVCSVCSMCRGDQVNDRRVCLVGNRVSLGLEKMDSDLFAIFK